MYSVCCLSFLVDADVSKSVCQLHVGWTKHINAYIYIYISVWQTTDATGRRTVRVQSSSIAEMYAVIHANRRDCWCNRYNICLMYPSLRLILGTYERETGFLHTRYVVSYYDTQQRCTYDTRVLNQQPSPLKRQDLLHEEVTPWPLLFTRCTGYQSPT